MKSADPVTDAQDEQLMQATAGHPWRLGRFPTLMPQRIEEILLVSSPYDSFILEEDGLLTELISSEYSDLGLTHSPNVTRVSTAGNALSAIEHQKFDLVIAMQRLGDMDVSRFASTVREVDKDLPIAMLVSSDLELKRFAEVAGRFEGGTAYVWHGDAKLFLAIIKVLEDRLNVEHDTRAAGVGTIIFLEDSIQYRSLLLPILYSELVNQTRSVLADGINRMHKTLRMRARPKILVADTYEQGVEYYSRYRKYLFGVIADVRFPREGIHDPRAGLDFIRMVKADYRDMPALLQSSEERNRELAEAVGAQFLHKRSPTLLQDVRDFMLGNFGFGDFVFRLPDHHEITRAADLRAMRMALEDVPAESIEYHARRNHFSNWLRARTEFELAARLRPRRVSEFGNFEDLRRYLIDSCEEALRRNRRGVVEDFSRLRFDEGVHFARIGGGSLGGKARGLAFVDALIARHKLHQAYKGVQISVPRSVVIGTDVFDGFLATNNLWPVIHGEATDRELRAAFLRAEFPKRVLKDLRAFLHVVRDPIAVRSSSLLEDSQYHPFAGIYETFMIPNNEYNGRQRLARLADAIKLVYASAHFAGVRRYLQNTPYRIEEQKMAVVMQPVVGQRRGRNYYPSFAGTARSFNFYPVGHMRPEDGIASVVLGLGGMVVDGGAALRFCPAHPRILPQFGEMEEFLNQSQRSFLAIDLESDARGLGSENFRSLVNLDLEVAERDGTLAPVGSVWSPENDALYDGIHRAGVRVVTFAHVLKSEIFPLAKILRQLLAIGKAGLNAPVDVEFAANLDTDPMQFVVLQIRPCVGNGDQRDIDVDGLPRDELLCDSPQALGNGVITGVSDILYVRPEHFDPARTETIAHEIGVLNADLAAERRNCMLIGPGRWGTTTNWLGIPVNWSQISTARVIVEAALDNFTIDPSQGSHFFHNLTSFGIAYLSVNAHAGVGFIDWDWLHAQPAECETDLVRHVRLPESLEARVDGRSSHAAVLKRARRVDC